MSGMSTCLGWFLGMAMGSAIALGGDCANAQIKPVPDNTLGPESSIVAPNVAINGIPSDRIDGGAIRGKNLFHSFREFNIDELRGAALVIDASQQIASGCAAFAGKEGNTFTVTGRGGLPPSPDEPLSSDVVWSDTRLPTTTGQQHGTATPTAKPPLKSKTVAIVPATGWVFNGKGEVTLISRASNASSVGSTPVTCPR